MTEPRADIDSIFIAAIEIESPQEREAYLRRACGGDAQTLARVEKLLAAHFQAGQFLEAPAPELLGDVRDDMTVGSTVGRYKLLQQIGEGGMGAVFRAHQSHPVQRDVALKIIKLGMDTRQVIARFDAERQALAVMDHPNIAKVFDAGSTETGRPYFVMELVRGVPITEYCDQDNLNIAQRLELFAQVCQALHHAHQKGLIHRDIKPSNVLVSRVDDRALAKVIDFGIAKATQARLTEKTLLTEFRQLVGTPEYMSPEQAEGTLDIDTRTDVYSLGVLLYELLVGTPPFDARELRSKAYAEMQRIIREVDPPTPSTRLSTLDALPSIAARRATEPRKLSALVRGELDWIVMKCLEKDRARRYDSASALAADITRHLADEPVSAGPASRAYRLRKFVRRHRGPVISAAIAIVLLVGGVTGTTLGLIGQSRQRRVAEEQRSRAIEQQAEAQRQSAIAGGVSDFLTGMLGSADPDKLLGDKVTVLQAIAAAVKELDAGRLKDHPPVEAAVRQAIGQTLRALGRYDQAEPNLRRAVELRRTSARAPDRELAHALAALGNLFTDQGKLAEAEQVYTEALSIDRATSHGNANDVDVAKALQNLGWCLSNQGKHKEAVAMFREALAVHRRAQPPDDRTLAKAVTHLGLALWSRRELGEAEPLLREAVAINRRALPPGHPDLAMSLSNLALVLQSSERYADAEPLLRESLEISRRALPEGHPDLATPMNNLAHTLLRQSKLAESEALYRQSLAIRRAAAAAGAADPSRSAPVAASLSNLADVLRLENKMSEAQPLMRESLEIFRRALPRGHPTTGTALTNLGWSYLDQGLPAEAEPLLREAWEIKRQALPPAHPEALSALGGLALALQRQSKFAEAEPLLLQAENVTRTTSRHQRSIELLIALYNAWDNADPGKGYDLKARQWQQQLPTTRATTTRSTRD